MSSGGGNCCCEVITRENLIQGSTGEVISISLMRLLGIGAVAATTLYQAHTGSFQVDMVWGPIIVIVIYAAKNLSCVHFNPAVTFATCISRRYS